MTFAAGRPIGWPLDGEVIQLKEMNLREAKILKNLLDAAAKECRMSLMDTDKEDQKENVAELVTGDGETIIVMETPKFTDRERSEFVKHYFMEECLSKKGLRIAKSTKIIFEDESDGAKFIRITGSLVCDANGINVFVNRVEAVPDEDWEAAQILVEMTITPVTSPVGFVQLPERLLRNAVSLPEAANRFVYSCFMGRLKRQYLYDITPGSYAGSPAAYAEEVAALQPDDVDKPTDIVSGIFRATYSNFVTTPREMELRCVQLQSIVQKAFAQICGGYRLTLADFSFEGDWDLSGDLDVEWKVSKTVATVGAAQWSVKVLAKEVPDANRRPGMASSGTMDPAVLKTMAEAIDFSYRK